MAGQVTADEYKKVKDTVNSTYTQDSLNAYKTAYNDAMKSGKSSKEAYASASGLLQKIGSGSSSGGSSGGGSSSSGGSSNTSAGGDVYGDVSGVRSKDVATKDYSNYTTQDLGELSKFGASAREMESAKSGSISKRNDIIAGNLYNQKTTSENDIRKYLEGQVGFTDAEKWEQDNTVDAIKARLRQMEEDANKNGGDGSKYGEGLNLQNLGDKDLNAEGKAGYYNTKDGYQKIYGYDEFDEETKNLVDRLDDSKKKYVSNLWASGMQEDLKYYLDTMRAKDQAKDRQDINKQLYDINRESSLIQAEQTIRNAEESYNNLKQNWQYLGNLGMPGVSATKIQAIGDAITEAKTTLGEVKRLTQLSLDAQEKQWEGQVLQYNQQIDNLMYDLKWKVGDEITNALSKYTTAELEGQLDTIDGITAFRKELLDDLDNNLSGLTSASLSQMQWINQQYQDIANRMYEYAQNANVVNPEMSTVKGYYVDGNGNPILNNQGQPIQVPQNAPMEPVFDKESGRLITFGLDENGNIVASVQQVYQGDATATQSTIVSLLEQGVSVQDILKYVPGVDLKTVQALAEIVKPIGNKSYTWSGGNYTAVSQQQLAEGYKKFFNKYVENGKAKDVWGGQCGHFVNDYLESMGIARLFTDPITDKEKCINSDVPKVGSVVIMNSESAPEYGHVGIVVGYKDGKISILQSNKKGEEHVFTSSKSVDDSNILGYFDPTKSIDQFNKEMAGGQDNAIGDYDPAKVPLYKSYLDGNYTNIGDLIKDREFQQEAYNYGRQQGSSAALDALEIMAKMSGVANGMGGSGILGKMGGAYEWNKLYNQLSKKLTLNELTDLKARSGASLGAMSEGEWKILGDAASNLSKWGVATGMQSRAWSDELRALTLAAYPMEANQSNWQEVLNKHQRELMGEYYVEGNVGSNGSNGGGRQTVDGGNL